MIDLGGGKRGFCFGLRINNFRLRSSQTIVPLEQLEYGVMGILLSYTPKTIFYLLTVDYRSALKGHGRSILEIADIAFLVKPGVTLEIQTRIPLEALQKLRHLRCEGHQKRGSDHREAVNTRP